jgi:hypothetical protein
MPASRTAPLPETRRERIEGTAALAAGALVLAGVALWNGYPLVYPDTATYVTPIVLSYRTPFYNAFAIALHGGRSVWPIVAVQSLLLAWLLRVATRAFFGWSDPGRFLVLVALLALLSSLPWFTGQLLPDVFAGVLVLALALLALAPERCTRGERLGLALALGAAVLFHQSHAVLALALLAALAAARALGAARPRRGDLWPAALAAGGASAVLALANLALWGQLTLSVHGATFLLGSSIQDGPTLAYLRETCPARRWALCPYLDLLPWPDDQQFLWNPRAPFNLAGGFDAHRDEAREIVLGSLRARPAAFVAGVLATSARQLVYFPTGADNVSFLDEDFPTYHLRAVFPREFPRYAGSLQSRGRFPIPWLVRLHEVAVALAALASVALAWRARRAGRPDPARLLALLAAALVGNALVLGGLSGVVARYQGRVVWLPVYFALAAALAARPAALSSKRRGSGAGASAASHQAARSA